MKLQDILNENKITSLGKKLDAEIRKAMASGKDVYIQGRDSRVKSKARIKEVDGHLVLSVGRGANAINFSPTSKKDLPSGLPVNKIHEMDDIYIG